MTGIWSCLDTAQMEFMLCGKATHKGKVKTSFSGSKRMEPFLLKTQILAKFTTHLTLGAEVMDPTVLRCLKSAGSRSWTEMVKQYGPLIRPKLSA